MAEKDKNMTNTADGDFGHERDSGEDIENPDLHSKEPVCVGDPDANADSSLAYGIARYEDPNSERVPEEVPDEINVNIPDGEDYISDNELDTSSVHSSHTMDSEMNEDELEQAFCIPEIVSAPTRASETPPSPTEEGKFSVFHLFSFLPAEIRQNIWADALPGPRTIHILYNVL